MSQKWVCPEGDHEDGVQPLGIAYGIATKHDHSLAEKLKPPPLPVKVSQSLVLGVITCLAIEITLLLLGLGAVTNWFFVVFVLIQLCFVANIRSQILENNIRRSRRREWERMIYCSKHDIAIDTQDGWKISGDKLYTYFQPKYHHGYDKYD